jgi:predicted nucleic acid-binding protein
MKYVLDSSAALPCVLPEKDSAKAIQLRDDARNGVHELLAPDIFPAEIAVFVHRAALVTLIQFPRSAYCMAATASALLIVRRPKKGDMADDPA